MRLNCSVKILLNLKILFKNQLKLNLNRVNELVFVCVFLPNEWLATFVLGFVNVFWIKVVLKILTMFF